MYLRTNSDVKSAVRCITSDQKPVWPALVQEVEPSFNSTFNEFLPGGVRVLLGDGGLWRGRGKPLDLSLGLDRSVYQVRRGGEGGGRRGDLGGEETGGRGTTSRSLDGLDVS